MKASTNYLSSSVDLEKAVADYRDRGWCDYGQAFPPDLLAQLKDRVEEISKTDRPEVVHEEDSDVARAIHGCHRYDDVCDAVVRSRVLVDLAEALIGSRVYVYQFKVNVKAAREGLEWPWHQDFAFWSNEDGMPTPSAVTIAINLDEVHADNGPLRVLDGSHSRGLLDSASKRAGRSSNWRDDVSSNLSHAVPLDLLDDLLSDHSMSQFTGAPGAITAFHPCLVHSSSNNHSSDRRSILFVTYNSIDNAPAHTHRPNFLVDRDTRPV